MSVVDTISVGDGGCGAAVADTSDVACADCDDDVATEALGLACRVPVVKGCTATDHGLCVACSEGFFTTLDECQARSTNTKHCVDKKTPLTCVDNVLDGECA